MSADVITFLVVDDVPENLVAMEVLLRRDGLQVLCAKSATEALELLLVHDVALAFLDVQMPEIDGFELAELMRGAERTKHIPIIFVTAGTRDPQRVFKGYEAGAVDFLFKPIEPHVLSSKAEVFFELSRQRREFANALRLNEMFVGILGHDLRNPLGAILGGVQLLQKQLADESQKRVLSRMQSAGARMTDMIEQLLDLTRARLSGGLGFARTYKRLDVANLVKRTVEELRAVHPAREIAIVSEGDTTSAGDPERLLQLFSNLVANALQHGPASSVVSIAIDGGDADIAVRVSNPGVIPADVFPTIFDPFRGRRVTSNNARGLGLGLFISQQIALAHGGSIAADSSESTGVTTFTVRLPRRSIAQRGPSTGKPGRLVLIVDDDESIRDSLKEAFEEEGYDVATASNGREALDRLRFEGAPRPDVVILDLVLPVMDGGGVYRAMQADPALSRIPVIVSTSNPLRAPSGVVVIPKPLKLERLLQAVAALQLESAPAAADSR